MIHQTTSEQTGRYEQLTSEQARLVAALYSDNALEYYLHLCPARAGIRISLWRVRVHNLRIKREILYSYLLPERKALLSSSAFALLWLQLLADADAQSADADAQSAPAVPAPDAVPNLVAARGLSVGEYVLLNSVGALQGLQAWAWVTIVAEKRLVKIRDYHFVRNNSYFVIEIGRAGSKTRIDANKVEIIELHNPRPVPALKQVYNAPPPAHVDVMPISVFAQSAPRSVGYVTYQTGGRTRYAQIQSITYNERSEQFRVEIKGKKTGTMQRYLSPDAPVLVA